MLVAPLDWGLGHATRCIPLIKALTGHGYEVVLAAENAQAALLQKEFPQLPCIRLTGYRVRYSRSKWLLPFRILLQVPRLFRIIRKENAWLQGIIDEQGIDLVISDNRFGLFSDSIPCVFITHQLTIKAPFGWLERKLQQINYQYINRFTECWVPDAAGEDNLAGILSHPVVKPLIPVRYIGLLSRFQAVQKNSLHDYCFLLSGPEPQRTILEEKIVAAVAGLPGKTLLVRGLPAGTGTLPVPASIQQANHLPSEQMQEVLLQSEYIICRSGYTTVMEIVSLGKKAILIPTPGQTEQEYLAQRLSGNNTCFSVTQDVFSCAEHLAAAKAFHYRRSSYACFDPAQLPVLIDALVKRVSSL